MPGRMTRRLCRGCVQLFEATVDFQGVMVLGFQSKPVGQ